MRDGSSPLLTLPTAHRLRAAAVVCAIAPMTPTPVVQLRAAYPRQPSEGLFTVNDLRAAESDLIGLGLLELDGGLIVGAPSLELATSAPQGDLTALVALILNAIRPVWLQGVEQDGEFAPEAIPDDALNVLRSAIPDPDEREALLLSLARRYSAEQAKRIGDQAEIAVVEALRAELTAAGRPDLAARVRRVSLISDQLGYDVTAPQPDGRTRRIEVKGTTLPSTGTATFHLSRNEATVAMRDPSWSLVLCAVQPSATSIEGWIDGSALEGILPSDGASSVWESARIGLERGQFTLGLPELPREGR